MVTVSTAEAIGSAKFVALYFSAHCEIAIFLQFHAITSNPMRSGCPPCRAFTPVFAKAYSAQGDDKDVQVRQAARRVLLVVCIAHIADTHRSSLCQQTKTRRSSTLTMPSSPGVSTGSVE